MPEIGGVGGRIPPQKQAQSGEQQIGPANKSLPQPAQARQALDVPAEKPGTQAQPPGTHAHGAAGHAHIMTDAIAGRDPSQALAAEQLRATGGSFATDELLGLNHQPSIIGAFAPPPDNREALRHMTPARRRALIRSLLGHQSERMRRLVSLVQGEHDGQGEGHPDDDQSRDELKEALPAIEEAQRSRARVELGHAEQMLNLLEELLAMQDYTLSQMGKFSQG